MKKKVFYTAPEMEVVRFMPNSRVLTLSGGETSNQTLNVEELDSSDIFQGAEW